MKTIFVSDFEFETGGLGGVERSENIQLTTTQVTTHRERVGSLKHPWEFEFPYPGSLASTFLAVCSQEKNGGTMTPRFQVCFYLTQCINYTVSLKSTPPHTRQLNFIARNSKQ